MPIVPPRRMMSDDVSGTPELSGGGGEPQLVPSRVSVVLVEEAMAGDTPGRECPGEDLEMRPFTGTKKPSGGTVSDDDSRSPCGGGGTLPLSVVAGRLLPVDVTDEPTLSVEGPQSVPSWIAVVRVDGTIAGDTPGWECPREDRDWQPRAGVTRPAGVSVSGSGAGSLRGGTLPSIDVAGSLLLAVPAAANPAGPVGPVVAGGPDGLCETLSPIFHKILDPLEHSVLDHAGPAGRHIAVGPVSQFRTLSSSDCHPAGPAGPYVAGGPVGPDYSFEVLEPLEHSVLDHADPAGQHAAIGPVGPFRTSSDCHPAGPAGPYVAGGPVGPDDLLKVLELLEHSVLDHADPAGQHAVVQDVLELLEHSVLDTILDGRPLEGITVLEPLEHSVLDLTLDGGLLVEMSDWEPLVPSLLDVTLDGRPIEGIPDPEPLENSVLVMALDSGLTDGMSHIETLEHSVLNSALVARPMEGTPVLEPLEHSVLTMMQDDKRLEVTADCEPLAHAVLSVALDRRPMEGIPDLEPLEHLVLGMALDSGLKEGMSHVETVRTLGSECCFGRWTCGRAVAIGTVRAFGSECGLGQWHSKGKPMFENAGFVSRGPL